MMVPNCTFVNNTSAAVSQLLFAQLISTLHKSFGQLRAVYPNDHSEQILSQRHDFDFIIVGAGSAGCAIANRLTEIPYWKVLLIEAGSDPPVDSDIPILYSSMLGTKYDWNYKTESSNVSFRSLIGNKCECPRGKMLGGSSSINGNIYVRGHPNDYDHWRRLGNPGWNYASLLPYFKRLERVHGNRFQKDVHGYDGYMNIEDFKNSSEYDYEIIRNKIKQAGAELNYPFKEDHSAMPGSGVTVIPGTLKNGVRWNTAKAYLVPIRERKNLLLMKNTLVTKLLIDDTKRIYGVEVYSNDQFKNITCTKEVILSAGVINTPQLMMLSGLGPKENLEEVGIPLVQDLKVGCNLQDHVILQGSFIKLNAVVNQISETDRLYNYLTRKTDLATIKSFNTIFFVDSMNKTRDYPDVLINFYSFIPKDKTLRPYFKRRKIVDNIVSDIENENSKWFLLGVMPFLLRPKSRGRISLSSKNPFEPPTITMGYLTESEDVKTIVRGLKFIDRLVATKAFRKTSLYQVSIRECMQFKPQSDEFYECRVRNLASTGYHLVGTCKMGPDIDPDAVVDSRLEVYGVKGLRIADASIMPTTISGYPYIPVVMIAEKAADMVKSRWFYRQKNGCHGI